VIYRRRSNRIFKKDPLPRELIERVLEAGRYAPSAGNCQPVRYIAIDDRARINEIRDGIMPLLKMLSQSYRAKNPVARALLSLYGMRKPEDMDIRPIYAIRAMYEGKTKHDLFHNAPVLILVLGDTRGVGNYSLDCGIAAQNLVLTAHALGLGTCYVGFIKILNGNRKLKKKLGIKWPYRVITSIAMGYPKVSQDREVERKKSPITWLG